MDKLFNTESSPWVPIYGRHYDRPTICLAIRQVSPLDWLKLNSVYATYSIVLNIVPQQIPDANFPT
jgi:hypothetical protein